MWRRSENNFGSQFRSFHMWGLGFELRVLGLTAGVFIYYCTVLLARKFCLFEFLKCLRIF